MGSTKIEWATHTSNWLAGCTKVSPACTHCYAESMSVRLAHRGPDRYQGVTEGRRWTGVINYDADAIRRAFQGLRNAKKPRRVFVNSMSDTFHADAPPESLVDLAEQIALVELNQAIATPDRKPWPHVIMLLTKRPERLRDWQREHFPEGLPPWVWVGCTVEDQERANGRVPVLLDVKTDGVRYLSCEPLLGPVDIDKFLLCVGCGREKQDVASTAHGDDPDAQTCGNCGEREWGGIHWLITGGESGPNARPSHPDWFRNIRDQCEAAGVPHLFKQWGEWGARPEGALHRDQPKRFHRFDAPETIEPVYWYNKKTAGRLLDGRTWDEFPTDSA